MTSFDDRERAAEAKFARDEDMTFRMIVHVNHDGQVLKTDIVESSGNKTLDRRAESIARSAAPFGNFSPVMRAKADQILVVSRFKFTRDETLETRLTGQ